MDIPKNTSFSSLSDLELIDMILAETRNANHPFKLLYDRYKDRVYAKCYSLVRNNSIVEDLAQDIFVKAIEHLPAFRKKSSFSTWLYAITYNHCIEYLRKNKRIRFDEWASQIDLPEEVRDHEMEEILDLREERVQLLLEMLKPEDKAILLMKYKEGMRIKTIVEITGAPSESAMKMKLNRAKKRLVGIYHKLFKES